MKFSATLALSLILSACSSSSAIEAPVSGTSAEVAAFLSSWSTPAYQSKLSELLVTKHDDVRVQLLDALKARTDLTGTPLLAALRAAPSGAAAAFQATYPTLQDVFKAAGLKDTKVTEADVNMAAALGSASADEAATLTRSLSLGAKARVLEVALMAEAQLLVDSRSGLGIVDVATVLTQQAATNQNNCPQDNGGVICSQDGSGFHYRLALGGDVLQADFDQSGNVTASCQGVQRSSAASAPGSYRPDGTLLSNLGQSSASPGQLASGICPDGNSVGAKTTSDGNRAVTFTPNNNGGQPVSIINNKRTN